MHRGSTLLLIGAAVFLTAAAGAWGPALAQSSEPIQVVVDHAKVLGISRPADVVIIGNPAIADATIQDSQTLIITGRSFGMTNLIVLDSLGETIANEVITVGPQNDQVVTVYRRSARETLSCTPDCSPILAVGDTTTVFDSVSSQIQAQVGITDAASGRQ
jgi:Flp pilus assembly secretin CpaC